MSHQGLERCRDGDYYHIPIQLAYNSRWNLDYLKLNQVVTSVAAALPNVVLLLEQINISPGTWYAAIGLSNVLFSIPINKTIRSNFLSAGKTSNMPSQLYFRAIETFQFYP